MVKVKVNDKTFELFKQIDVSSSIDNVLNEAQIVVTEQANNNSFIKIGDMIKIYLDDVISFTGYADLMSDSEDNESHDIVFRLRDKACDLIDSTVPNNCKNLVGVKKLKDLIEKAIKGLSLDLTVTDNSNTELNDTQKAGEVGQNCGDFLTTYARVNQCILNTDPQGNIIIRSFNDKLKTMLLNKKNGKNNNILSSNIDIDFSQRFYKYIVRSQGNLSDDTTYASVKGEAIDDGVRKTRVFEKIAEKPMTKAECDQAAKETANLNRIRGFNYECTVVGFSGNGELWEVGKLVKVEDDFKGIDGWFLIKNVDYAYSENGEITKIILTYQDAYKKEPATKQKVNTYMQASKYPTPTKATTDNSVKKNKGFYETKRTEKKK